MDLSELERLENPAKVLKLSEAIRIGAKIRPQCTNGIFWDDGKSCAIGAAAEAVGFVYGAQLTMIGSRHIRDAFPDLYEVASEVFEWNDSGMTRETIADRLEAMGL